jgi:hypothetical protein
MGFESCWRDVSDSTTHPTQKHRVNIYFDPPVMRSLFVVHVAIHKRMITSLPSHKINVGVVNNYEEVR